jgi:hypothetical protein
MLTDPHNTRYQMPGWRNWPMRIHHLSSDCPYPSLLPQLFPGTCCLRATISTCFRLFSRFPPEYTPKTPHVPPLLPKKTSHATPDRSWAAPRTTPHEPGNTQRAPCPTLPALRTTKHVPRITQSRYLTAHTRSSGNLHSAHPLVQWAQTTRNVHTQVALTGEEGAFTWTP